MSDTIILLARHGATGSNLARPYILQGRGVNFDLDPLGVKQAEALSVELKDVSIAAVYASPLKRSQQTAAIVGKRHGLEPVIIEDITEAETGEWEGLSWDKIAAGWPKEKAAHDDDPSKQGYPGGESFLDVRNRCIPAFQALADKHAGETIFIAGHNVVNRVSMADWMGIPIRYSRRLPQNNAAYNVILFPGGKVHVQTVNITRHLSGLIPPD